MVDLRTRDFRVLNESILILHSGHQKATFSARLQEALSMLIPGEVTAVECFDMKGVWTGRMLADPTLLVECHFPSFLRECESHPLFTVFKAGQLWQPFCISDVVSQRNLRERPIFSEFLKPLGVDRQMAITMKLPEGSAAVLVFSRKGQDFRASEKMRLRTFIPHVISAQRIAGFFSESQSHAANKRAATPPALMIPSLKAELGITEREAEIVYWLAHGKTDFEIGLISRISKRTVQKHCENIYRKLGVECRTATVIRALERYT